jgi:4-hydroxy-tetrahydrodipicolinate reductase
MIRVGILGYHGRMGQLIAREIASHKGKGCVLVGGADHIIHSDVPKPEGVLLSTKAEEVMAISDVVIDFTVAEATPQHAQLAAKLGKAFMSGTTGLSEDGAALLHQAAKKIPLLYARNTSLSLAATKRVAALAAKLLAPFDYDISILDEHHRMKKDAPSGTALVLGEAVKAANGGVKHPSYAAIRSGYIVGEHEVQFAGDGESIRIRHSVTDRSIFARGAVQAALWLHGKPNGFYGMDDVLGI